MGDTGPNLAAIYVSLSQTYKDQCQLSKALEYCEKELQIWENNPAEVCEIFLQSIIYYKIYSIFFLSY